MEHMFTFNPNSTYYGSMGRYAYRISPYVDLLPLIDTGVRTPSSKEEIFQTAKTQLNLAFRGNTKEVLSLTKNWTHVEIGLSHNDKDLQHLLFHLSQVKMMEKLTLRQYVKTPHPDLRHQLPAYCFKYLLRSASTNLRHFKLYQVQLSARALSLLLTVLASKRNLVTVSFSQYLPQYYKFVKAPRDTHALIASSLLKRKVQLSDLCLEVTRTISSVDMFCLLRLCDRVVKKRFYIQHSTIHGDAVSLALRRYQGSGFTKGMCRIFSSKIPLLSKQSVFGNV